MDFHCSFKPYEWKKVAHDKSRKYGASGNRLTWFCAKKCRTANDVTYHRIGVSTIFEKDSNNVSQYMYLTIYIVKDLVDNDSWTRCTIILHLFLYAAVHSVRSGFLHDVAQCNRQNNKLNISRRQKPVIVDCETMSTSVTISRGPYHSWTHNGMKLSSVSYQSVMTLT